MIQLLDHEPALVHARNEDRETSLMVATTYSGIPKAIEMMKLLIENGAKLGSHDRLRRQTLIYACTHNADLRIIEALLDWNEFRGGTKFNWHDRDSLGQTALTITSKLANTAVTTFLLDKIDIVTYAKHNHPFKILKEAIDSGNEKHALVIALHGKIQSSIEEPEITRHKGSGFPEFPWTISTCTEAAIDQGMIDLVQVMNQLNRRKVSRAVWYSIYKRVIHVDGNDILSTIPRVLVTIGRYFTDVWRWKQVGELCLVRYGHNKADLEGNLRLFSSFPDEVFHRIVAFVVPPAFKHPIDFEERWCHCYNMRESGECRWHDCYEAKRTDYDRHFNYRGTL
ncbi:hypothetical protein PHMEG_000142 [Phytophthora megakarya]|uniref:Uncharacterized protein n=1 Tax=Phytophthora megakarya TaxID=4795 RepID=A0A225X644_9STRA|nr:hypothetical protein PHMEG_000142 [Phytophthora megakarya]